MRASSLILESPELERSFYGRRRSWRLCDALHCIDLNERQVGYAPDLSKASNRLHQPGMSRVELSIQPRALGGGGRSEQAVLDEFDLQLVDDDALDQHLFERT